MKRTSSDLWRSAAEIFDVAVILQGADRDHFVSRSCAGDARLETAVRDLLAADHRVALEREPLGLARSLELIARLDPGAAVGAWTVVREIGSGGMGRVYLAERSEEGQPHAAAIKVLTLGVETDRFRQERQVLASLSHPNIAALLDGGTLPNGRPYVVMEFVDGRPLNQWCREERPSLAARLRLFVKLCSAVAHAHRKLVVHRDIKPANILVTPVGEPKLLDFGIAKILGNGSDDRVHFVTATDVRVMTLGYASPEQVRGEPISTASDIYSLGVLLYELLTGARPFASHEEARATYEQAVLRGDIVPPSRRRPRALLLEQASPTERADLDAMLLRMLALEPDERYRTVAEVMDDVEAFLENRPVRARRSTRFYTFRKLVARHRLSAAVIGSLTTTVVVLLGTSLVQSHRLRLERDAANAARAQAEFTTNVLTNAFRVGDPVIADKPVSLDEVLDRAYEGLTAGHAFSGEVPFEVLSALGHAFVSRARFEEAAVLLAAALEGAQHAERSGEMAGRIASSLAYLYFRTGKYEQAEALNQFARQSEYWSKSAPEARIRLELQRASILASTGRHLEAIELGEQLVVAVSGLEEPPLGLHYRTHYELADTYRRSGDHDKWALHLRLALSELPHLKPGTLDYLSALRNQALLSRHNDGPNAALDSYTVALQQALEIYGPSHPEVARVRNELGNVYFALGQFDKARTQYERALEIYEAFHGLTHRTVIHRLFNIGLTHKALGGLAQAEWYVAEAISRYRQWPSVRSTELPYFLLVLAEIYRDSDRLAEALETYRESIRLNAQLAKGKDQQRELTEAKCGLASVLLLMSDEAARSGLEDCLSHAESIDYDSRSVRRARADLLKFQRDSKEAQ